jgi:hypothetical protein
VIDDKIVVILQHLHVLQKPEKGFVTYEVLGCSAPTSKGAGSNIKKAKELISVSLIIQALTLHFELVRNHFTSLLNLKNPEGDVVAGVAVLEGKD